MIIIYILAGIGALTVLSIVWMIAVIIADERKEKKRDMKGKKQPTCALTNENCIFVSERMTCIGCPIAEEAEKRGYR